VVCVENVRFDFLRSAAVKIVVFRNFMPCTLIETYQRFGRICCLILHDLPLDGHGTFPQNTSKYFAEASNLCLCRIYTLFIVHFDVT
jgi:hypothetical protein